MIPLLIAAPPAFQAPAPPARPLVEAPVPGSAFGLSGRLVQGGLVRGAAPRGTVRLTLDGKPVPTAPDGRFLLGFDRDQARRALLAAELADGRRIEEALAIAPGTWKIEWIAIARSADGPTPAFQRIREPELARIEAARASASDAQGWRQVFVWPARGRTSGLFGSQRVYRGVPAAFHGGVDIAAGAGATVVAPADGVVVLAGPPAFSLEGNLVILDHGLGLNSAFLHLSESFVRVGQRVRQGEAIGKVGMTGRATGPHLHWAVKWGEARIDPAALVVAPGSP